MRKRKVQHPDHTITHIKIKIESAQVKEGEKNDTLKEKLLSGLVGIHGTFLEHCIDVLFTVIARDLLDVLDRPPHTGRN